MVSGSVIGTFGDMCVCSGENGGIWVEGADKWRCLCEREETRPRSGVKGQDGGVFWVLSASPSRAARRRSGDRPGQSRGEPRRGCRDDGGSGGSIAGQSEPRRAGVGPESAAAASQSAGETEAGPRAPDGTGRDTITAANGAAGERDSGDPNI